MGSHSVTCHPTQVNASHLTPTWRLVLDLPIPTQRDGRLSWPSWLDSAPAGSQTSDLSITCPTPNHCTTKSAIIRNSRAYLIFIGLLIMYSSLHRIELIGWHYCWPSSRHWYVVWLHGSAPFGLIPIHLISFRLIPICLILTLTLFLTLNIR